MAANEIVIQNTAKGMTATFYGPKSKEITDLFSTNVLPLPLAQYAPMGLIEEALATIKRNFPGYRVSVV